MISNPLVFTVLSKFNGFDGAYLAGTHYVTDDMSYDEIMYILTQKPNAVRVTFPEGLTYSEVKERLAAAGVSFDEKRLDSLMKNPQLFIDYPFVAAIDPKPGRDWLLQGYLYPDTYEFDMNTDEETIIRTFLNNAQKKLQDKYFDQAQAQGISLDEAITLASIVQVETSLNEEMRTISGVFWNRMKREMPLGTDTTINYMRKEAGLETKLWLSQADIDAITGPYNTYTNQGLPPGPICSPGDLAIKAALWPASHDYLYFVAKGDGTDSSDFSYTLDEHTAKVAKYQAASLDNQEDNG
ncbi:MAG: endolytic transglycosylase MltG [Clostridiales bacterium]|nr:endolytic transglycosylase MltG [Clostridiales bacterium]